MTNNCPKCKKELPVGPIIFCPERYTELPKELAAANVGKASLTNTVEFGNKEIWMILKWVLLGLGFISLLIGFDGSPFWLVVGCFFGIVSRIMQAEEHK